MRIQTKLTRTLFVVMVLSLSSIAQIKPVLSVHRLYKSGAGLPYALMNGNNVTSWVHSDGFFNWLVKQSWNGEFPKGSGVGTIFSEGIVFGGFVNDGLYPQALRVNGSTYFTGMQSGAIQTDASGNTIGADDPTSLSSRAFAVRPDMPPSLFGDTLHWPNLTIDAATYLQKSADSVTAADRQQIANQYFKDWSEWPAKKGAPWFVDDIRVVRNDGAFDPTNPHHIPGIPDAAKTVWFVCNDLNPAVTVQAFDSPPMGIEEQITLWAYNLTGTYESLDDVIYKQVMLIYRGNPNAPDSSRIDSMYLGQWVDPDIGDGFDDYAGSDSSLNLGFAYNSKVNDSKYSAVGMSPPAVGYVFLQGTSHYTGNPSDSAIVNFVWRKGYRYWTQRPLTSFELILPSVDDPIIDYSLTQQWYNMMRGCLARPVYPASIPFYTSSNFAVSHGLATSYALSGDPTTSQGWIDGIDLQAGDRRMICNHGPFTLELHDTAEVAIALVDGMGANNLWSISVMKYNATFAQFCYRALAIPSSVVTGIAQRQLPRSYEVAQNYPNPFNPSTTIRYQIPVAGKVMIRIYNVLGQEIATLVNEQKQAGSYSVKWNASNVPSGIYFYRTEAIPTSGTSRSFIDVKKMILLK